MAVMQRPRRDTVDHQLERIGWALFLIMIGGLWLLPDVPGGTWLIGTGLIMLGLSAARQVNGLPMSMFPILAGIAALALGVAEITGIELPVFPLVLILMGASILWKAYVEREAAA